MKPSWSCSPASRACSRSVSRTRSSCSGGSSTAPKCVSPSPLRLPGPDDAERALPRLDVDVGRRRRGERVRVGRDDDAGHVADERPAGVVVEVADVVGGVAGGVLDAEGVLDPGLAALEHPQVLLRDRDDLAPQPRQALLAAVEPRRARDEPLGVDEVLGAALVDVDRQVGPAAHERARGAGVVEVDVGQQQRARAAPRRCASSSVSSHDCGPGSTSTPSTSQQQMTCSWPRCLRSIARMRAAT